MNISKLNYASLHDRNDINFPAVLNKIIFTSSLLMEELPCGQKKKFEYPLGSIMTFICYGVCAAFYQRTPKTYTVE
jgi:hypothetical protein